MSEPTTKSEIDDIMQEAQELFADSMERHGFGRKTFKMLHHQDGKFVKRLIVL